MYLGLGSAQSIDSMKGEGFELELEVRTGLGIELYLGLGFASERGGVRVRGKDWVRD